MGVDLQGNMRELTEDKPLKVEEILVPEEDVARLLGASRQVRRAWYREQAKGKFEKARAHHYNFHSRTMLMGVCNNSACKKAWKSAIKSDEA